MHLIEFPYEQLIPPSFWLLPPVSFTPLTLCGQQNNCINRKTKSERENFARQSAHTARVGATCPTTARAMIAMVEEGSFITADFSGEL